MRQKRKGNVSRVITNSRISIRLVAVLHMSVFVCIMSCHSKLTCGSAAGTNSGCGAGADSTADARSDRAAGASAEDVVILSLSTVFCDSPCLEGFLLVTGEIDANQQILKGIFLGEGENWTRGREKEAWECWIKKTCLWGGLGRIWFGEGNHGPTNWAGMLHSLDVSPCHSG